MPSTGIPMESMIPLRRNCPRRRPSLGEAIGAPESTVRGWITTGEHRPARSARGSATGSSVGLRGVSGAALIDRRDRRATPQGLRRSPAIRSRLPPCPGVCLSSCFRLPARSARAVWHGPRRPTTTTLVVVVSVVISLGIITIAWARGRISSAIQDEPTQWILVWGHGSRPVKLTIPQRRRLLH